MTVKRTTPTTLRKEGRTYTTLPNDSIALIKSADALAIWCYLQTRPQDWVIRKQHIMDRLGMSRRRYTAAMQHLMAIRLVDVRSIQGAGGRLAGRVLLCFDTPTNTGCSSNVSPRGPGACSSVPPKVPNTDTSVSATIGESVPLQIKDINTNNGSITNANQPETPKTSKTAFHPSHREYDPDKPVKRDPDSWPAKELQQQIDAKAVNGQ